MSNVRLIQWRAEKAMIGRMEHVGYRLVIETLKAGGRFIYGGGLMFALYGADGRYAGSFTRATRDAAVKRLRVATVNGNVIDYERWQRGR